MARYIKGSDETPEPAKQRSVWQRSGYPDSSTAIHLPLEKPIKYPAKTVRFRHYYLFVCYGLSPDDDPITFVRRTPHPI